MIRWTVAGLIVVGLLVGIWMVWPSDGSAPTTAPEAAETTTSEGPTTTTLASTTTTLNPLQVRDVETVAQAEAILRELWFGWFEGIYNQDEDRIREVVATEEQVEDAQRQFGQMEFSSVPDSSEIDIHDSEILRVDAECLVMWMRGSVSFLNTEPELETVEVLRWVNGWRFYSAWRYRDDLWQDDCDTQL